MPSDFELVYRALGRRSNRDHLATGQRFIEWGSGIGVVTCLAEWLGFDAVGIEIERSWCDIAEELADDHDIDAQFACGSFVPHGAEPRLELRRRRRLAFAPTAPTATTSWSSSRTTSTSMFAYPWPAKSKSSSICSPTAPRSARCC